MNKIMTALGGIAGALLAACVVLVIFGVGAYLNFREQAPEQITSSAPTVQPDNPAQKIEPAASEMITPPSFDELRRETDGTTIIAGRAAPLSDVKILLDGAEVATVKADSTGGFAAIATLPSRDTAQIVSLSAQSGTEQVVSQEEVILAPSKAQLVVPQSEKAVSELAEVDEGAARIKSDTPRVAVLKSDTEGVSLLAPVLANEIALDTIGYSALGEVQLSGRAKPDTAKVRVYLDNRSVVSLSVGPDGRWRGDLPDVDEGIYTLRVDEVSASGAVSSRVETPFKRESAELLSGIATGPNSPVKSVTVQTGATLWAIARDRYGDGTLYVRVFEANSNAIRNPDLIYPGQVFDLPN